MFFNHVETAYPPSFDIRSFYVPLEAVTLTPSQEAVIEFLHNPDNAGSLERKLRYNSEFTPSNLKQFFGSCPHRPLSVFYYLLRPRRVDILIGLVQSGEGTLHRELASLREHRVRNEQCYACRSGHIWQVDSLTIALFDKYSHPVDISKPPEMHLVAALTASQWVCVGNNGQPLYEPQVSYLDNRPRQC